MARNKGLASFSAHFEPNIAAPLDARSVVANKSDLVLTATWQANDGAPYTYIGMIVSVSSDAITANNGIYRLAAADFTQESNWEKASGLHDVVTKVDSSSIAITLTGQQIQAAAIFGTTAGTIAEGSHNHDTAYSPAGKGVTNGDSHDHSGGDGAQIAYSSLGSIPSSFTPASHTHGNITNTGYLGVTSSIPLITGTGGIIQAGSFGNTSGTFCQGNDSRLTDARTPTAHTTGSHSDWPVGVTMTEIGYLDGVTSPIQSQLGDISAALTAIIGD